MSRSVFYVPFRLPHGTRDAAPSVPGEALTADALLRRHKRHWCHRGRDGAIVPFSEQPDPWTAFRTYRAISRVGHAERHSEDDIDAAFISHWIAFNACYGTKDRTKDRTQESALMGRSFGELLRQKLSGQRVRQKRTSGVRWARLRELR